MASKRSKTDPTEDFDDLFEGIGDDTVVKKPVKSKPSAAAPKSKPDTNKQDILAELENQLVDEKPSRPHTPRIRETAPKGSPLKRTSTNTPPPPPLAAEDKTSNIARKSGESTRSYHASFTPSATSSEFQEPERKVVVEPPAPAPAPASSGGGWWGGILSTATATATAAMKQAEAAAKSIQQNEEAKKWAEQVRGINVGALKGFSTLLPIFLYSTYSRRNEA